MNEARVTFKDYVEWTIHDLDILRRSVETPDEDLPNIPTITVDGGEGVSTGVVNPDASPEQKRARMVEAAMPRLEDIYQTNLRVLANTLGGMTPIVNNFFKGLDQVFKADTTKPKNESVQDYLGRKILNPIRKLRSSVFKGNQALVSAQYVFELVEKKAQEAGD